MSIFEYFYYLIVAGFLVLILVFISFPDFKTIAAILKTVKKVEMEMLLKRNN